MYLHNLLQLLVLLRVAVVILPRAQAQREEILVFLWAEILGLCGRQGGKEEQ